MNKKIFAFWAGKYMSWLRYMTLHSARKYNPDAEIILLNAPEPCNRNKVWPSHNIQDSLYYEGPNYFEDIPSLGVEIREWVPPFKSEPAQQCDISQWSSMYEEGGLFIDMDIVFTGNLDYLFERQEEVVLCYHDFFSIGVTGGLKGCAFHKRLLDIAKKNFDPHNYSTCGTASIYKLLGDEEPLNKMTCSYYNIPQDHFYKYDWQNLNKIYENSESLEGVRGVHWYGGAPASKEWNNKLFPRTLKRYSNTLVAALREVL